MYFEFYIQKRGALYAGSFCFLLKEIGRLNTYIQTVYSLVDWYQGKHYYSLYTIPLKKHTNTLIKFRFRYEKLGQHCVDDPL